MKEKAKELINLLEKELSLYNELFFNEFDKGCLVYEHEIELFNKRNETSSLILNKIGTILEYKKSIIELFKSELKDDIINIEKIVKIYLAEEFERYDEIKEKLKTILSKLAELNNKNKIILDTTYSISKIVIDGLNRENIYNEKGSLCESYFSTVRYNV
ncbi:MAG: hypothetical protein GYA61_02185 [Spirochaetales bacterium]|nr:hypothetical protein [Spirochaetales bacterium]